MFSFNLTQVVSEPTRVSDHSCILIDLAFVSSPPQVISCETIPPLANSDHFGIQLIHSIDSSKKLSKISPCRVWKYTDADFIAIANFLDEVDWDSVLTGDVESCWTSWKRCFLDIMNECIPHYFIKSNKNLLWMSKAIIQAMRKRKALF